MSEENEARPVMPELEKLIEAIEGITDDFKTTAEDVAEDAAYLEENREKFESLVRDMVELARVAKRLAQGKPLAGAFSAPGDWGYDHPVGKALAALYRARSAAAKAEPACAS